LTWQPCLVGGGPTADAAVLVGAPVKGPPSLQRPGFFRGAFYHFLIRRGTALFFRSCVSFFLLGRPTRAARRRCGGAERTRAGASPHIQAASSAAACACLPPSSTAIGSAARRLSPASGAARCHAWRC